MASLTKRNRITTRYIYDFLRDIFAFLEHLTNPNFIIPRFSSNYYNNIPLFLLAQFFFSSDLCSTAFLLTPFRSKRAFKSSKQFQSFLHLLRRLIDLLLFLHFHALFSSDTNLLSDKYAGCFPFISRKFRFFTALNEQKSVYSQILFK